LKPVTVAKAARSLFATGHSESIVFFFLKAQGASTDHWINVSSSNEPPDGLMKIAGQPEGFDNLVKEHLGEFSESNDRGLPTRPGVRGSVENYSMFFPITEEPQYILRKRDANRNAVWSNITGSRNALNSDRASRDDVEEQHYRYQTQKDGHRQDIYQSSNHLLEHSLHSTHASDNL
jgi:hypothetical protein